MSDPNQPNQPYDPSEEATRVGPPPASGSWPQQNQPPQSQLYPSQNPGQQYPQQPGQQYPQRPPQQGWPQQPQGHPHGAPQGQAQGQPAYGSSFGGPGGPGGPADWGGGPQGPGSGSGKGLKLGLIIGGAVLALVAAVGLVVGLTRGGDDEASADETTAATTEATESTEETTEPTESSAPTESESAAPAGDVTAPGTDLSIGDQAVLPVTFGTKGTGTVSLTVTEIAEGTSDDLRDIDLDENPDDYTPYYIKVDMELISQEGDGLGSYTPGSDISGLMGEDAAGSLIVFGDFEPCNTEGFDYDAAVGDTVSTCVPALAENGGDPVDGVMFSTYDTGYDQFDGDPVTWH